MCCAKKLSCLSLLIEKKSVYICHLASFPALFQHCILSNECLLSGALVSALSIAEVVKSCHQSDSHKLNCSCGGLDQKFLGLFLSVHWMFYILMHFPFVFVNVYSDLKKALGLLIGVFCWLHEDHQLLLVAACQCDVLILCTLIVCMRCIGFAVAVIRVTSSHAT